MSDQDTLNELLNALCETQRFIDNARLRDDCGMSKAVSDARIRLTPKPPSEDSVQVRIAVAVNENGIVGCYGIDQSADEAYAMRYARKEVDTWKALMSIAEAIVTAYIPRLVIPVVPGVVEEQK